MVKILSKKIAYKLGSELKSNSEEMDIFVYGLEIIFGGFFKFLAIVLSSYLLGSIKTTMICLISYIPFRHYGGGVHFNSYGKCFTIGLIMFILLGKLSMISIELYILIVLIILSHLFIFYGIIRWVPAGTHKKQITNPQIRTLQKIKTFIVSILWSVTIFLFMFSDLYNYVFASVLGGFFSMFFISPSGYRTIHTLDGILNKFKKEEVV